MELTIQRDSCGFPSSKGEERPQLDESIFNFSKYCVLYFNFHDSPFVVVKIAIIGC